MAQPMHSAASGERRERRIVWENPQTLVNACSVCPEPVFANGRGPHENGVEMEKVRPVHTSAFAPEHARGDDGCREASA